MIIRIGTPLDQCAVSLVEPQRFDRLHVEAAAGATRTTIDSALRRARAGEINASAPEAAIAVDWIRGQTNGGESWNASFAAMLAYAASKGWYAEDSGTIRAHVEYRDTSLAEGAGGLGVDEFRAAFRGHPAGVAVITADDGSGPVGLTATSVFSVSADPPLLVFSVSHSSSSSPTLTASKSVVVHLLGSRDLWIAELCATSGIDRFADTSRWDRLPTGEPFFPAASRWLRADVVSTALAGTSTIMTVHARESGSVADDTRQDDTPLVYHNRTWHTLTEHSELGMRAG